MSSVNLLQVILDHKVSIRSTLSELRINSLSQSSDTEAVKSVNSIIQVNVQLLTAYLDGTDTTTSKIPQILGELSSLESQLKELGPAHPNGTEIITGIKALEAILS